MIDFPCPCGHLFHLEDDEAGGLAQCPRCSRLNDVPTHTELLQIAPDGTYKVEAQIVRPDPDEVAANLAYIYQRGVRDARGHEIDLRLTPGEEEGIGVGPLAPLTASEPPSGPRYDPETGELITEFGVKADSGPSPNAAIPMARPALQYASGAAVHRMTFAGLFIHLLNPLNVAVMIGVFGLHLLLLPLLLVVFAGIMFLVVAIPILGGMIVAHYGNVIEEIGPFDRDELPRPLRDLGWYEDIWAPFAGMFGALMICYGPALLAAYLPAQSRGLAPWGLGLALVLAAFGTFFLPGVMLTLTTSGTGLNLRPDRLLAVISACGKDYLVTVVIWIAAAAVYLVGFMGTTLALFTIIQTANVPRWLTSWSIVMPLLALGIFLMHYFCVCLGMLYRVHYGSFPWVLQRHVSTRQRSDPAGLPPARRNRPAARDRPAPKQPSLGPHQP